MATTHSRTTAEKYFLFQSLSSIEFSRYAICDVGFSSPDLLSSAFFRVAHTPKCNDLTARKNTARCFPGHLAIVVPILEELRAAAGEYELRAFAFRHGRGGAEEAYGLDGVGLT
jgi:hypothetical protein